MGRWVELEFELSRTQTQTVTVVLDEDELLGYDDVTDVDPWDYLDSAWENEDRSRWSTDDTEVNNAVIRDSRDDGRDEDEEAPRRRAPARQPEPDRSLLPGRLVIDGDGSVYEVESVSADGFMVLLDVDTGEQTDDYGGRQRWNRAIPPGFYRWYRSGDHVITHDGSHQTVVGASDGLVTLLNGQVYAWQQTYSWTWEEEQAQEETA